MSAHGHHHHNGDFDWDTMADALEVDGSFALPLVDTTSTYLDEATAVSHVIDAGCGPGVVTCALAQRFPTARITGIDSAGQLLDRLRTRARDAGFADRVRAVEADIEHDLPPLAPADLVWASMVVHHVADPVATLRRLGNLLRPGGTLVMIEFGGDPRALPDDDPLVALGAWARLEAGARAALVDRLGPHVIGRDWPRDLALAGLADITDEVVAFSYAPPLDELRRRWLARHVHRGIGMAGEMLPSDDAEQLQVLAHAVEAGGRPDAFVEADRRVLTARRSGSF